MNKMILPKFLSGILISICSTPTRFDSTSAQGVLWQSAADRFLLDVPNVARYLVEGGAKITIEPAPDASALTVQHYLELLPLAALIYQCGSIACHASVVANENGAVLLTGDSGSGKSTLLTVLLQRGWNLLSDDLAVVVLNEQGQPVVYQTSQGIALWPSSLEKLGIDCTILQHADANRYEFKPEVQLAGGMHQLRGIYRLNVHNKNDVEIEEIAANARFRAVGNYLYNSHVADALCNRVDYMRCAAAIAQSVPINILRRPRGRWSVDELADVIEKRYLTPECGKL